MFNPVSTYRIQFHKGFTFSDFELIIPYLEKLGVKTIYASPIFEAAPESTHGYDGINPLNINPEIGTIEQLRSISQQLRAKQIGWIQDIVPNHMAYHANNPWLMDLLEKGPESAYRDYFDQSLSNNFFKEPIMVPFLGSDLDEVITNGELIVEQANNDKLVFNYAGNHWPLKASSYPDSQTALDELNKDKERIKQLANEQYYRLCSWKETDSKINYRRFFTVNSLICINIQKEEVFNHFHQLINELLKEGVFQGLRVDHIDGLFDPTGYLQQLRKLAGKETYIIVEKILEAGEQMPQWPIQGNTGYDFLAIVNNLFTNRDNEQEFTDFYQRLTGSNLPVKEQIKQKKAFILKSQMAGELENLTQLFLQSDFVKDKDLKLVSPVQIKEAIAAFIIDCPVYKYYGNSFPLSQEETKAVKKILKAVESDKPELIPAIQLLQNVFTGKKENEKALYFYQRCMQFTGPLMAKGVEDTLMYTYNRFIAHNEVGDAPDAFGLAVDDFNQIMIRRQQQWPLSMNGTSTHDTKRGEDARARLNVLTDIPEQWFETVASWRRINSQLIQHGAPDANDECFIYETLLGTYPMPGQDDDNYAKRIEQYLEKTLREAKVHSNWAAPDEAYETATKAFASSILNKKGKFWDSFTSFHQKVSSFGVVNSLAQVLLKFTTPGMPDVYQGCELYDLSMVDPDNRRPVDYKLRDKLLQDTTAQNTTSLWDNKFTGQLKLWLTRTLLQERKNNPLVFAEGDYIPLQVEGKFKANLVAFARHYKRTWYVVAAPLNLASLCEDPMQFDWEDTHIVLPANVPDEFEDLLQKKKGKIKNDLTASSLFEALPAAFLKLTLPESGRSSGILMHITSLPSSFGIGDFGPGARTFADLLHNAYQKYWQLLPLSPVDEKNQYSPYSSWSAMGGNTLLISPEQLIEDGLLSNQDLEKYLEPSTGKADFKTAAWLKDLLFEKAWTNFKEQNQPWLQKQFKEFCAKEAGWLNDFALFSVLKAAHDKAPWYQWPDQFKFRDKIALAAFEAENLDLIEKTKWLQFIFTRQWQQLKTYCNQLEIQLFGDLPFYVSYDSVDAWSYPEIFSLDEKLDMKLVAGVPPDYFNANGQLWGMPVFCWGVLKAKNYEWWLKRIEKNLEFFDVLRLDHFRAFSSYWAVPAGEETAINGTWQQGPGNDLFDVLKEKLGKLPFIAEDLGDIDEAVYKLRDDQGFPGMKVLQFAFGGNMPQSPHIPHNYIPNHVVYTGTHDNNTTTGWFASDADEQTHNNLELYIGIAIAEKNIAKTMTKLALSSVAQVAIIPVQDILVLDESARMNMPAGTEGNWLWRLTPNQLKKFPVKRLKKWAERYNRV